MANTVEKTPFLNHEHPMYGWAALAVVSIIIVGLAGWWLLVYQQGLNDDIILEIKKGAVTNTKGVSSNTTSLNVDDSISTIDSEINSVLDDDLEGSQLDDASLGIN